MTTDAAIATTLPHAVSLPSIDELVVNQSLSIPPGKTKSNASSDSNGRRHHHRRVATDIAAAAGGQCRYNYLGNDATRKPISTFSRAVVTTAPSSNASSPSSSLRSTSSKSIPSSTTTIMAAAAAFQTTPLLQNMMRSHKNRNPYIDYVVLGMIGKGSIGSVEKVVRRHHSVMPHGDKYYSDGDDHLLLEGEGGAGFCAGGIFNNCCHRSDVNANDHHKKPRQGNNNACWSFLSKLFINHSHQGKDAFQSSASHSNNNDSTKSQLDTSIVSESSAFSAPSTPTMPHRGQRNIPSSSSSSPSSSNTHSQIRSTSQHGTPFFSSHPFFGNGSVHNTEHPLRRYALKSIRLDRTKKNNVSSGISSSDEAELRNEISILRSLDHPHIVHIIETYEYKNMIFMVIDLCENGDLYVLDPYSEGEVKVIMRQLLQAVSYMHHRGIVHRDLKFENVMFSSRLEGRSKLEIKVIDFGLSMKYGRSKGKFDMSTEMTDFVGTIYTMAPEVIRGSYTYKCDIWSLGVMAYMLLSSQIPFYGDTTKEIARHILFSDHSFSGRRWLKISKKARDFVSSLLVRDPSSRPTADQALKNPWLVGVKKPSFNTKTLHRHHSSETVGGTILSQLKMAPQMPLGSHICTSIENYSTYSWMHRLALMVIAYRYTGEETTHLRRIFTSYDVDDNGTVEMEELSNAFALHDKYSREEIDQIFLAVDMNGSGKISWTEFLAATIETKGHISEAEFSSVFEHLDFDKNGYISTSDLREIIGRDLPQSTIDQIIDESDIIGDHKIWKDEFLALGEESTVVSNMDHQRRQVRVYLKRSKSADDFDLVKTRSLEKMHSDSDVLGDDKFRMEKAKSVRKATKFA